MAETESIEVHCITRGESINFSLKRLFARQIGNATIDANAGNMAMSQIISHEADIVIPRGIAKSTPVTMIASIRCRIRKDEIAPVTSRVLVLNINDMTPSTNKISRPKMRQCL